MPTTTGKIGDAYEFDSGTALLLSTEESEQFAFDPALQSGGTIFFWYKITGGSYSGEPAFEFRIDWPGAGGFVLAGATDGSLTLYDGNLDGTIATVTFPGPMDVTEWHFVCATFDNASGDVSLYIDDSPALTQAGTEQLLQVASTTGRLQLTQQNTDLNVFVDELGVSTHGAYSADQVTALWNAGDGVTWPDVNSI